MRLLQVRSLALSDVMFCRALAESTPALHALHQLFHVCLTPATNSKASTAASAAATSPAATPVLDPLTAAATAHYLSDIFALLIPAHPKRFCSVLIAPSSSSSASTSSAASAPAPFLVLLCRALCDSALLPTSSSAGGDDPRLPSLALRQSTQTFVLRALFFVVQSVGLHDSLLAHSGAPLTYLSHYAMTIRGKSRFALHFICVLYVMCVIF